jgi:hypothetical protein
LDSHLPENVAIDVSTILIAGTNCSLDSVSSKKLDFMFSFQACFLCLLKIANTICYAEYSSYYSGFGA